MRACGQVCVCEKSFNKHLDIRLVSDASKIGQLKKT